MVHVRTLGVFVCWVTSCSPLATDSGTDSASSTGGDAGGATGEGGGASGGEGSGSGGGTGSDDSGGETLPRDGLGALSGDCDVLDTELTDSSAHLFTNTLDFGTAEFSYDELSEDGQTIHDAGNLGGSSLYSEIFAFETLYRCELAELIATEGEIVYTDPDGKKTDLIVDMDGERIGVSVTRAYGWPPEDPWTVEQAVALLTDKLDDVQRSSENVADGDAWRKQVLAIVAYTPEHVVSVQDAWASLSDDLRADTIIWVTATEGDDAFLY